MREDGPKSLPVPGTLYIVATPIGNLADITSRAEDVLGEADLIVAEDTRRTGQLLSHLGLSRPMTSCHKFNEASTLDRLIARLAQGQTLAMVTDSGTPAISDPGYRLVAAAHDAGLRVEPLPGPCAVIAALSAAGFPADRFYFAGFLPTRSGARQRTISQWQDLACTLVVYEAPHRLLDCLRDLLDGLGDRQTTICRELTKLHEEIRRDSLSGLLAEFGGREKVRGEIVLVIAPQQPTGPTRADQREELREKYDQALSLEENDTKRALRRLSRELNLPRAEIKSRLGLQ